jgi:thiol:disulfide interchange protein DsbC
MKRIARDSEDIAFYIKLYPLSMHPQAYAKSKAIVCEGSLELLEAAMEGKAIPEPSCETGAIDRNIALARELGISGTPTVILPDGSRFTGYKGDTALRELIEEAGRSAEAALREEAAEAKAPEETVTAGGVAAEEPTGPKAGDTGAPDYQDPFSPRP